MLPCFDEEKSGKCQHAIVHLAELAARSLREPRRLRRPRADSDVAVQRDDVPVAEIVAVEAGA